MRLCECKEPSTNKLICPVAADVIPTLKYKQWVHTNQKVYPQAAGKRRRRSLTDNDSSYSDDIVPFVYDFDYGDTAINFNNAWPTPSGITEVGATQACQNAINAAAGKSVCSSIMSQEEIDNTLSSCKFDVQV